MSLLFCNNVFFFLFNDYWPFKFCSLHFRHFGPSNELHTSLEEAFEQFKNLERDRKKVKVD